MVEANQTNWTEHTGYGLVLIDFYTPTCGPCLTLGVAKMVEANQTNWTEHTGYGLVLIDFYTPTCGPCRMLAPVLEQLENVKVVKVNAAENWELSAEFNVQAVPALFILKDGVEVASLLGYHNKEKLQAEVNKHL